MMHESCKKKLNYKIKYVLSHIQLNTNNTFSRDSYNLQLNIFAITQYTHLYNNDSTKSLVVFLFYPETKLDTAKKKKQRDLQDVPLV